MSQNKSPRKCFIEPIQAVVELAGHANPFSPDFDPRQIQGDVGLIQRYLDELKVLDKGGKAGATAAEKRAAYDLVKGNLDGQIAAAEAEHRSIQAYFTSKDFITDGMKEMERQNDELRKKLKKLGEGLGPRP